MLFALSFSDWGFQTMPCKIRFSMTWLSWLSHCVFFNKERKRIDKLDVYVVFCLIIFLFSQSKNIAVLEPGTKHFRELVRFEAEAQGLSFKAKDVLEDFASAKVLYESKII